MGRIISGAEFGTYKMVGLSIGQAKNENLQGVKSRYVVMTIRDKSCGLGKPSRVMLWEDEFPGLIDAIKGFASQTPNPSTGGYDVDLARLKADPVAKEAVEDLLGFEFVGGCVLEYKLAKGLCYQNDIDGKPTYIKGTSQRVTKAVINVFCIIKNAVDDGQTLKYNFVAGFGLNEQGARLEGRFYREAVNGQTVDDSIPLSGADGSQMQQQAVQQPTATQQAPAQQATPTNDPPF